ncbi:MAG: vitamin K epoxide reductase family protein [Gemmatimonadetes bacterium]|nr:vitamin K epoxide reductase family protein [Gemmatimonadota bacterium]
MAVAVLSLAGTFLAFYLVANNLGWVPRVPCGTGDCGIVQSSRYAWVGPVPVSAIGLAGYLGLFVLSLLGLQESMARSRLIALLLFGGALTGVLYSGYLTYLEAAVIEAWCRYCVASAILITVVFLATIPEVKRIRGRVGE